MAEKAKDTWLSEMSYSDDITAVVVALNPAVSADSSSWAGAGSGDI